MDIYRLGDIYDPKVLLRSLGVESGGVAIMANKMELFYILIKDLKAPAVNILKQDALSIGADLAVPSGVVNCEKSAYDCLLIGTKKHIEILSRKELAQPFGLKEVAKTLKRFLESKNYPIRIMGVINANDDSFYQKSRFVGDSAICACEKMIEEGATIVDIGAVSSRPRALSVSIEEEMSRIQPICDAIKAQKLYQKALFSIDGYTPSVVEYALKCGFGMVNDITGASDQKIIELAIEHNATLCIMHMQGTPQTMQHNPFYKDITAEVSAFFEERISKCEALGLRRDKIILDVGIGFGKSVAHNIRLLQNMRHFTSFGCELLVGASRKSMIDTIIPTLIEERLPGTLAIHLKALEGGATIVRCHDVAAHFQAIKVWEAIQNEILD